MVHDESFSPPVSGGRDCASDMSSRKSASYRLSPRALIDLEDIWRYTAETWSIEQADRRIDEFSHVFDVMAGMPTLAPERRDFDPPVRIHVHESHLIVYRLVADHLVIVRLLGGRQDWVSVLKAADL